MDEKLYGVNLGGWLLLEKWLTPSLFAGTDAEDEYTLQQCPGMNEKIERHRQTFITEADFRWLHDNGVNAVRIPVGYWLFGDASPYAPTVSYLDWAVTMAAKYDLKVLIDLHGAPGSQNGADHSGQKGAAGWYKNRAYRQQTIEILERIAVRYRDQPIVWGIQLLNEPKLGIMQWKLRQFYRQAYARLTAVARPGTRIVFHDAFMPLLLSGAIRQKPEFPVVMDVHWYHFGGLFYRWRGLERYFALVVRRRWLIQWLQRKQPIIVGEWSLVLSDTVMCRYDKADEWEYFRQHSAVQLAAYEQTAGWFYWTYKAEGRGIWHFRSLVEEGVLTVPGR